MPGKLRRWSWDHPVRAILDRYVNKKIMKISFKRKYKKRVQWSSTPAELAELVKFQGTQDSTTILKLVRNWREKTSRMHFPLRTCIWKHSHPENVYFKYNAYMWCLSMGWRHLFNLKFVTRVDLRNLQTSLTRRKGSKRSNAARPVEPINPARKRPGRINAEDQKNAVEAPAWAVSHQKCHDRNVTS